MKLFTSILFFSLFILSVPGWGQCSKNVDCSETRNPAMQAFSETQPVILQGTFLDDQEISEIDGPESFILNPVPSVNSLQYMANTITIVLPFTFQVHINNLLIDLPPPALS